MDRPVVYYIFDVLCGWCYGFSPVIAQLEKEYRNDFDFRVISGGMILGEREGPIGEVAAYIKDAYKEVEATTGVTFGEAFLKNILAPGTAQFSSLPGALALATFRLYQPDNALAFARRMQEAIYKEGLPPVAAQTFGHCAEDFGMNATDFMRLMVDKDKLELVQNEFKVVKHWDIQGFPSVVYQKGDKGYLVNRGYRSYQDLKQSFEAILAEVGKR